MREIGENSANSQGDPNEKKNYDQIAKEIGYDTRSAVSKLFKRAKERGWINEVEPTSSTDSELEFPVSDPLESGNRKQDNEK